MLCMCVCVIWFGIKESTKGVEVEVVDGRGKRHDAVLCYVSQQTATAAASDTDDDMTKSETNSLWATGVPR